MKSKAGIHALQAFIVVVVCNLLALVYAVYRYHVIAGVPASDFPIFILNKALSLAALFLISFTIVYQPLRTKLGLDSSMHKVTRHTGRVSFFLILAHILLSVVILNPTYYSSFFTETGRLSVNAGLCLLAGIVSFIILMRYHENVRAGEQNIAFLGVQHKALLLNSSIVALLIHLFFRGYPGWLSPAGWPGTLPPISLISFAVLLLAFFIRILLRNWLRKS